MKAGGGDEKGLMILFFLFKCVLEFMKGYCRNSSEGIVRRSAVGLCYLCPNCHEVIIYSFLLKLRRNQQG